jgi:hypothetical protein
MRRLAAAIAIVLFAPVVAVRGARIFGGAATAVRVLARDDHEQRRLATYGECGERGYGYLRRVLRRFPEPDALPRIRVGNAFLVEDLLPELRPARDSRVLVGIDVDWKDTREQIWPLAIHDAGGGAWRFRTVDYDRLIGIGVTVTGESPIPRRIELSLYQTPARRELLGRWSVAIPAGARDGFTRFDPPADPMSHQRGGVDYLIDVSGPTALSALSFTVVPIDAAGFTLVQSSGGCMTAVRTDFLSDVTSRGDAAWTAWLADVRGIQ